MIIGISGKMGSGKDYFVENHLKPFIINELKKTCLVLSLADMVKINLMVHHNVEFDDLYKGNKKPEIRKLLQYEGTENGRNKYGEDIWIKYVKAWSKLYQSRGFDIIIIPDIRFKNEYNFIKEMGGKIFRINSPERNEKRLLEESKDNNNYNQIKNHISETDLDDDKLVKFDYNINNNININIILEQAFGLENCNNHL